MRITYIHQYFNTPSGAGGTRSYEMARRMVAAGHPVTMITSDYTSAQWGGWAVSEVEGIEVHRVGVPYRAEMSFRRREFSFAAFMARAAGRAARVEADVVLATSTPLTVAPSGAWGARRVRAPFVLEIRDLWPEMPIAVGALANPILRMAAVQLEEWAYQRADGVIALSPGMQTGVEAKGYPPDRISMIPNASDLEMFKPEDSGNEFRSSVPGLGNRPYVLYAGSLGVANQPGWLVELAGQLRAAESSVAVVVIGSGACVASMRTQAQNLGVLGGNLFLLNSMPKASMPGAFAGSVAVLSVFAPIPEMEKNSSNKFFDGLAAGRPVLINYGGWHADLLSQSQAGLALPRDPVDAARQLLPKLENDDWVATAGRNARRLAETRFSRDILAEQMLDALSRAL